MATATAVRDYKEAQGGISRLAERELRLFFLSLDLTNIVATTNALQIFMPELVTEYGEMGAAVAIDFYDELREASNAAKPFKALMGEIPEQKAVQASVRWAVGPLFQTESNPAQALSNLTEVNDRFVKQTARNTIFHSAQKDPSKASYARVPSGAKTCKFCLMLASRGAVYANSKKAGENNKYHGHCDCQVIPMWDGDEYPEGYDPESLYDQYIALEVAKQGH
ncbi:hypothetical protein [Streptomyces lasalocidi]|uniref:Phage head morphogenesis domain-containing protein n=1 Tax=Streptomyces lasalocidi TaxID=324833 RepID=A0A4U5WMP3_STRLS|nr:hypothetical protein [Streptomyces lasalocidi]TKT03438.1 hypothetical protein E4U91_27325 [Streptomyces lasalocidi]